MRVKRSQGMAILLNGTSLVKSIILFFVILFIIFILTGMLTSLKPEYRLSSSSINEWTNKITGDMLVHFMGFENRYFTQAVPEEKSTPKISSLAFEMATSINPDDPRSLLGRELPYFSLYDGEILVAGEGTNYTNMPIESWPPVEVLQKERQASIENLQEFEKEQEAGNEQVPTLSTNGRKVVYIYHTHSRESYLPHLEGTTDQNEAFHSEVNVTLVGKRLGEEMEKRGIGAKVDTTDFTGSLINNGWDYMRKSYDVSRPVVEEAMAINKDLQYIIDIHRDALPKKHTTVTINGTPYARISFVIGGEHSKYEKNLQLAKDLHNILEEKYPGLSRGIITKQGPDTNGKFNQDISQNAILIEFGGVENHLNEVYRTAEAIAESFSEFYWQAEKVNQ